MEKQDVAMENWEIDMFCPQDAQGVVELYRAVYGDDYPVKEMYDPEDLIKRSQSGHTYRVVARTESGQVVGHTAFYRSTSPNPGLYESGQIMVRHDYRTTNMALKLNEYGLKEIPLRYGIATIWGESVCNHLFTQRAALQAGACQTAAEIDLMPGESYAKAFDAPPQDNSRVSTLVYFLAFDVKPQTIYLPPIYDQMLRFLYEGFEHGHTLMPSEAILPQDIATEGDLALYAGAGVARFTFDKIGADFAAVLGNMEQEAEAHGVVVTQIFFRLTHPWTGAVVDILRQRGYFIGGCLPRWFDEDGILMQKLAGKPNFDGMKLYGKRAKRIVELIKNDWHGVGPNGVSDLP